MPQWRPDQTFYPSPKMAMQAPPETTAFVAMLDPTRTTPDALGVVDVEPGSKSYGQIVGRVDMPNHGDELHHFGWNACSSCLCPYSPHPHMERRYLVVPGHAIVPHPCHRHKARSAPAEDRQGNRAGDGHAAHRIQPATHRALRTRRDLRQCARLARGRRPWRHLHHGPGDIRSSWPLGAGPWPAAPCLRLLVAPGLRHHDHQRVGHA